MSEQALARARMFGLKAGKSRVVKFFDEKVFSEATLAYNDLYEVNMMNL